MRIVRHSSGSTFEDLAGYSRSVVIEHGDHAEVIVSGCTGFDYSTMSIADDVVAQAHQAFANVELALAQAGGGTQHLVRMRYTITDGTYWSLLAPVFGQHTRIARPAATCVIAGLVDARMKVEIEADARIPRG